MKKLFPVMYDLPERTMSVAGLIYGIIGFYTLPFLALFVYFCSNIIRRQNGTTHGETTGG